MPQASNISDGVIDALVVGWVSRTTVQVVVVPSSTARKVRDRVTPGPSSSVIVPVAVAAPMLALTGLLPGC